MADLTRPDFGEAWASEGEKLSPDSVKIKLGWVQEMMPYQFENFLQSRQDEAILYLLQKGVPEYSPTQEYTANKSVVVYQGNLYMAIATVTGVLPTVTASWKRISPTVGANGAVAISSGGTGATSVAEARTNLGLGTASTANLPSTNGVVVRSADNTLISRLLTGTSGNISITNPDGVAGNININVGTNVAQLDKDSSWTSKGGITLPKGSSGERGVEVPGKIRYNTELQKFEGYNGTSWNALGAASEVEITTLSGDGITTSFTLNTSAFSESSTDVYIGGVYQNKGTYSVSGTTLTFSEAPTFGTDNIQVVSRRVVDLGIARASQVSIEDATNKYTATTVEGALREITEYEGEIEAEASWEDVPKYKSSVFNAQAQALANRVELLKQRSDAVTVSNYTELLAYTGRSNIIDVTGLLITVKPSGIAGRFVRTNRPGAVTNGGTIFVLPNGDVFERQFTGAFNIQWFGAVAYGPSDTRTVDSTSAVQAAIDAAGLVRGSVYAPAGFYKITSVTANWPLNMHGDGGQVFSLPQYVQNAKQGTVFMCESTTDYALKVDCPPYTCGLSLRDFSLVGVEGVNAYGGLFLNETGWTGIVQGVTIDNFVNEGLCVDYIQDTHFIGFTVMRCGNTAAHPAIKFVRNSNFIYFANCRFELCNYMIDSGSAFVVHFRDCHIESGSYGSPDTHPYEARYTTSPIVIRDGANDWHFDGCIFGPVSVDSLVATNGGTRRTQPHYITVSPGAFNINFNTPTVTAPQNAIDFLYSVGTNVHVRGGSFYNINPERFSVYIKHGSITGGTGIGIYGGWNGSAVYGVQVDTGTIADIEIGYGSASTITEGALIDSGVYDGLKISNVKFSSGMDLPCWAGANVNVSGQPDSAELKTVTGSVVIDFAKIKPGVHVRLEEATVTDAFGCQVGRKVRFINDSGTSTINHNGSTITTKGGINLSLGYFTQYEFVNTQAYGLRQIG